MTEDQSTNKRIGFAWYAEQDWDRLLEASVDSEELEDTWREWRSIAKEQFERMKERGLDVARVPVDPDELQPWCAIRNRPVDGEARSEYATDQLRKRDQKQDPTEE